MAAMMTEAPGASAAQVKAPGQGDTPRLAMPAVLLVSPDVQALQVMKSSLDRAGFEVDTALCPDVASRLYAESDHDALVIDEGAGSLALCRDVLARPRRVAPCVLLVSGADEHAAPLPDGVERLEKPLSLRYLVGRLTGQFGYFPLSV